MANAKQMMDIDKSTSMSVALSNEHQRNWDDRQTEKKAADLTRNYDPSRFRLNFQIGRGGVIQKVDKSKSIVEKIDARISEGVADGHVVRRTSHRSVNIVFGGNRERMLRMAFGDQEIGAPGTNQAVERRPDIEKWAKDIYGFCCREFGEDNVVSFIVHLDELNPHIHTVVVPITPDGRLSAKEMFGGKSKAEAAKKLKDLHSRLAQVNLPWNLERGDSIRETGARHVSLDEHHRRLSRENAELEDVIAMRKKDIAEHESEIAKKEKAIKSLTTMSENFKEKADGYRANLNELERKMRENRITLGEYDGKKKELEEKIDECSKSYDDKQKKLEEQKQELSRLQLKIERMNHNMSPYHMLRFTHKTPQIKEIPPRFNREEWLKSTNAEIKKSFNEEIEKVKKAYFDDAREKVEGARKMNLVEYGKVEMYRKAAEDYKEESQMYGSQLKMVLDMFSLPSLRSEVIAVAEALMGGYEVPSVGGGGGSSPSDLRWDGKKWDEDEEHYRHRCMLAACVHVCKAHARQGRGMRR